MYCCKTISFVCVLAQKLKSLRIPKLICAAHMKHFFHIMKGRQENEELKCYYHRVLNRCLEFSQSFDLNITQLIMLA